MKQIPSFSSEDEEREFWANQDSTEFVDWSKAQRFDFKNLKRDKDVVRALDASRGTTIWAHNYFRSRVLTSLLNDLIDLENEGIEDDVCTQIQRSLDCFINTTTAVPSGGSLSRSLYNEVDEFKTIFVKWTEVDGVSEDATEQRRKLLGSLRRQRQKVTDKARSIQLELATNLDRQILVDTYRAIEELTNLAPNLFKNVLAAYTDYLRRGDV